MSGEFLLIVDKSSLALILCVDSVIFLSCVSLAGRETKQTSLQVDLQRMTTGNDHFVCLCWLQLSLYLYLTGKHFFIEINYGARCLYSLLLLKNIFYALAF